MLIRWDEDDDKILFLEVNVTNFLLNERCQYFLLDKMSIVYFGPRC